MGVKKRIKQVANVATTIDEVFEMFINEKEALNLSPATIRNYQESYKRFKGFLNEIDHDEIIENVKLSVVHEYIGALSEDGLTDASINHYLRDLRAFLYWAMHLQYLGKYAIQMRKETEKKKETYTEDECLTLLAKPKKGDSFVAWRCWAAENFVMGTGSRIRTICNVKIGDIDFKNGKIMLNVTKNRKPIELPLSHTLRNVLNEYIKNFFANPSADDYLFPNVAGTEKKLTEDALKHSIIRYNKKRGIPKTSMHSFRRTFATNWIIGGGSLIKLQMILGHSTIDVTRNYVQMCFDDLSIDFSDFNPLDSMMRKRSRTHNVKRVSSVSEPA